MPSASYGTQSVPNTNRHSVFAGFFMATAIPIDLGRLTRELGIDQQAITRTVALLDEGNTVPFITRYRRDQTGGLPVQWAACGRVACKDKVGDRVER